MSHPETPSTLNQLLDLALTRHKVSYLTDLERIAKQANYRIVHTTLAQIRKGTYHSVPSKRTIEALAFLAGVPFDQAHQAAGLGLPQPSFAEQLPRHVDTLRPDQREAVLTVIRALLKANDAHLMAATPDPDTEKAAAEADTVTFDAVPEVMPTARQAPD